MFIHLLNMSNHVLLLATEIIIWYCSCSLCPVKLKLCISDCGVPPTHNHTQVNVTSSIYGSTVSYSCMTGYNRTYRGNSTLTCNATGHWDGTVDPCLLVGEHQQFIYSSYFVILRQRIFVFFLPKVSHLQ